jgi:K+/H+ antiporter YhaU regulatory subunit KhtT
MQDALGELSSSVQRLPTALVCYERCHHECHRSIIADMVADQIGATVVAIL